MNSNMSKYMNQLYGKTKSLQNKLLERQKICPKRDNENNEYFESQAKESRLSDVNIANSDKCKLSRS